MTFCVLFSVAIFTWFLISTVISLRHIPYCISDSYYALDAKGYIFIIVLSLVSILMTPVLFNVGYDFFGALTILGIGCVAICPKFKTSKTQCRIHLIGSIMAMIGSQLLVFNLQPWGFFAWIPVVVWLIRTKIHNHNNSCHTWEKELFDKTNWLWWIELGFFYSLWTSLLII